LTDNRYSATDPSGDGASPATLRVRLASSLIAIASVLVVAACGGGDGIESGEREGEVETAEAGPVEGELTISNWPLYIDKSEGAVDGPGSTLDEFEQETGASVKYIEDINDNFEFFGKLRPQLAEGDSGGRDIFVVTDYMAKKMYDLGYLQNLDKEALPNVEENLRADLQSPGFDPERNFSVPWQSGMTGIIVNTDEAPEINSIQDLLDPKYKGRVTFLGDPYDDVALMMKLMGIDPNTATKEDWLAAIDELDAAADSGQIRDFTGNAYINPLVKGDIVAAVGWSGDAIQLQADNPNIEWRRPEEGCNLWSDNMVIPIGAPNEAAALEFMNYVYDPEVQADIAEYVNYVTPVDGVREVLAERDPTLAENDLIFPDEEFTADCTPQAPLSPEDEPEVIGEYQKVIGG
jgi:spermidine/putrescine transport system substrate-binding protein